MSCFNCKIQRKGGGQPFNLHIWGNTLDSITKELAKRKYVLLNAELRQDV